MRVNLGVLVLLMCIILVHTKNQTIIKPCGSTGSMQEIDAVWNLTASKTLVVNFDTNNDDGLDIQELVDIPPDDK